MKVKVTHSFSGTLRMIQTIEGLIIIHIAMQAAEQNVTTFSSEHMKPV
jgi:hypothetical protein